MSGENRIVLVGQINPYGGSDETALVTYPHNCSGDRLCRIILGMTVDAYMNTFDRCNLCSGRWGLNSARAKYDTLRGKPKILLGREVCRASGIVWHPIIRHIHQGDTVIVLPHPSGLNRYWTREGIELARHLLVTVWPQLASVIGMADGTEYDRS